MEAASHRRVYYCISTPVSQHTGTHLDSSVTERTKRTNERIPNDITGNGRIDVCLTTKRDSRGTRHQAAMDHRRLTDGDSCHPPTTIPAEQQALNGRDSEHQNENKKMRLRPTTMRIPQRTRTKKTTTTQHLTRRIPIRSHPGSPASRPKHLPSHSRNLPIIPNYTLIYAGSRILPSP